MQKPVSYLEHWKLGARNMQSQLQIISQFSGQLLTITFEFISRCVSYQKINTSSFNVIDSIIVLYSKCSVTYLKLWEVWLKIDLLEFKILYLCWDFFLQRSGSNLYYIIQQKRGFWQRHVKICPIPNGKCYCNFEMSVTI